MQESVLGPVLFSLFINDLSASLPSSVRCTLYADHLAIWSSSPSVPTAVEATQGALFQLERWSEYWYLPLNLTKYEASFFSVDLNQAHLQANLLYSSSAFVSIPLQLFLGSPSTALFPFLKCIFTEGQVFPSSQGLTLYLCFSWDPSKESLSLLFKAFLWPLLTYASPGWFSLLSVTTITKLDQLHFTIMVKS